MISHSTLVSYRAVEVGPQGPRLTVRQFRERDDDSIVVVEPLVVGICRSDLKELEGTRTVRSDFGHEIVGRVIRSTGNLPVAEGEVVCLDPHVPVSRTTAFSELFIVKAEREVVARALVRSPSDVPARTLVFAEPAACARHAVRNLQQLLDLARARVAVLGAGVAGSLIAMILRNLGASVVVANRSPARLSFLRTRQVFDGRELSSLDDLPSDAFDAVVVTTAFLHEGDLETGVRVLRRDGVILLFAGTRADRPVPFGSLDVDDIRRNERHVVTRHGRKRMTIAGTYGAVTRDFRDAIALLAGVPQAFPVQRLIARSFRLEELPAALLTLATGSFVGKSIVEFD